MNDAGPSASTPQVRTLLLTDLCDSTQLVERLGDAAAADLFRAHDRLVLDLQQRWRGRLIDRSDGLLLLFERPIDGLGFALDYARGLRELAQRPEVQARKLELRARAGLHVGEVLTWRNSEAAIQAGAKSLEVEGLAKPLAARLMTLARPGQILLSATAEPLARRAARELGERADTLVWKSHGRWRFKGMPDGQEIYEVGEPGHAPLAPPRQSGGKAWRDIPLWRRPAALAAQVLLAIGMGIGLWFITQPTPAIAFNERDWVVVGDLRNLTGEARLDDSLEQAFHLSLEQSRYVNVLSDLKVRETLARMQRPAGAMVDRQLGAEVALRGGARALLLPTVAEVGGRLRVSLEVVDPRTQTTVYALYADGRGLDSALASIDEVTGKLRENLGESLQSIERSSVPLPNVGTPSLDALKAYALARREMETRQDPAMADGLYQRALQLDADFAMAYAGLGAAHAARGDTEGALAAWRQALARKARLTAQEAQRIGLLLRQYGPPGPFFQSAEQYLALYPDDGDVLARLGTLRWHQLNDFKGMEATHRKLLSPTYPLQGIHRYGLGIALLGQDRLGEAMTAFGKARTWGYSGSGEYFARVYDADRRRDEADRTYLASTAGQGGWKGEAGVVTAIDRGDWCRAREYAAAMLQGAVSDGDPVEVLRSRVALASVAVLAEDPSAGQELERLAAAIDTQGAAAEARFAPAADEARLVWGLLQSLRAQPGELAVALRAVQGHDTLDGYPLLAQLHQVALAEQERAGGHAIDAAKRLRSIAQRDDALIVVHWALARAERALGQPDRALVQARWLASHRGRAFAESTNSDVLRFLNIALTDRALLDAAELAHAAGRTRDARTQLQAFNAAFPLSAQPPMERARVAALQAVLQPAATQ